MCIWLREAAKKVILLEVGPLRGGGVGKGWTTKKKEFFWSSRKTSEKNVPTKLKGVRALVVGPLKKRTFMWLPLRRLTAQN